MNNFEIYGSPSGVPLDEGLACLGKACVTTRCAHVHAYLQLSKSCPHCLRICFRGSTPIFAAAQGYDKDYDSVSVAWGSKYTNNAAPRPEVFKHELLRAVWDFL